MADQEGRDVEMSEAEASKNGEYKLDLEEHSTSDLDEVIRDAVDAVERSDDGEDAEASGEAEESPEGADGLRERLLRTLADFDNYRKRAEREKETLRRMGIFEVVRDFLGVNDNLERALESSGNVEDLKQGLRLILRQQEELLRRHGVEPIESVGRPFDPTVHEAVAHQESADVDQPTVARELQKGYLLHDRLLRPAMVHVSMPSSGDGNGGSQEGGEAASDESREAVENG